MSAAPAPPEAFMRSTMEKSTPPRMLPTLSSPATPAWWLQLAAPLCMLSELVSVPRLSMSKPMSNSGTSPRPGGVQLVVLEAEEPEQALPLPLRLLVLLLAVEVPLVELGVVDVVAAEEA